MYPTRHPNPLPPANQHHAKEVISELCDRIKSEYTSMYSHIQNLKMELEKATSQRADYERYYSLNQDMSYIFNNEVHKMMDVIKRLVQACMQQVPFLPSDLQSSCVHLIEQVKHYTQGEAPVSLMHGQPPLPIHGQPQPHMIPPSHSSHLNHQPPPPHSGGPLMVPPHIHSGSHVPQHHPMAPYMSRMPSPAPPPQHFPPDSRDMYPHPHPNDMYRFPYKEPHGASISTENCNGTYSKDRAISSAALPKNNNLNTPYTPHCSTTNIPSGIEQTSNSTESPKEIQDTDSTSDKIEEITKTDQSKPEELISPDDSSSDSKSAAIPTTRGNRPSSTINPESAIKKNNEADTLTAKVGSISPNKRPLNSPPRMEQGTGTHPYERPTPPGNSISRQSVHNNKNNNAFSAPPGPPNPYYGGMPRHNLNGGHIPFPPNYSQPPTDQAHPMFPMGVPPPFMRPPPHMQPPFDPMMMPRNNAHMNPYGPIPTYPLPSISHNSYSHYSSEYSEGSYNGINSAVPKSFSLLSCLHHGDVVCAVSFSFPSGYAFTGSKGTVKIWDINDVSSPKLLSSVDCLKDNYVRACKSINDNKVLIVSGEHTSVGVWSFTHSNNGGLAVNTVCELTNPSPVCYDMAITPDEKHCYCSCSNGSVVGWDIETGRAVRNFTGHVDGSTCVDISKEGNLVWSGGLDATVRCWDPRENKQVHSFSFPTQVFSLSIAPTSDYIIVGLENKTIELCYCKDGSRFGERHVFKVHESCVLTVKAASSGKWLISSSKDNYTNCVKIPQGIPQFMTRENASILCTDISPEDKYVLSGGGEKKATIYECVYS